MKFCLNPLSLATLVALSAAACASGSTTNTEEDPKAVDTTDEDEGEPDPVDEMMGLGGMTGTPPPPVKEDLSKLPIEATLPMVLTEFYGPSGFMGAELEEPHEVEGIVMDEEGCTERPADAVGVCFKVTYTPQVLYPGASAAAPDATWAGAFFQNPEANWGEERGVIVEPGATKITFNAWTEEGPLEVEFLSGGLGNLGTAYADTFESNKTITLGDDMAASAQEISLVGSTYINVLGGFGWVLATESLDPIVFYIDNIQWVK